MSSMPPPRTHLLTLALVLAFTGWMAAPAVAQREMPDDPTPSASTDPNAPKVAMRSSDFETIDSISVEAVGSELLIAVVVTLSGETDDYEEGLQLKLWADWNNDRAFSDDELLLASTEFAADAVEGKLEFTGKALVPEGQKLQDSTMIRAVLCYGSTPKPAGTFPYGDVVDRSLPVQVLQPKTYPDLRPGFPRKGASFSIAESAPGKLGKELVLISPKGTAISITRTRFEVEEGDAKLGRPRRSGRTVRVPVRTPSTKASVIVVKPVFSIRRNARKGLLTLRTRFDDQTVTVGRIVDRTRVRSIGIRVVTTGDGKRVARLRIDEGASGVEDGELVLVSPKGTAISLTDTRVRVRRGDIKLGKPYLKNARTLGVPIAGKSTVKSRIDVDLRLDISQKAAFLLWVKTEYQPKYALVAIHFKPWWLD